MCSKPGSPLGPTLTLLALQALVHRHCFRAQYRPSQQTSLGKGLGVNYVAMRVTNRVNAADSLFSAGQIPCILPPNRER